jgi:acyl phosphate:glycerol-3-phosphate acyltransferase
VSAPPLVWPWPLLAAVLGYAVGSLSPAAAIARARGTDLRGAGSGNPGATNAGRVMGRRVGYLVGALDVLKGLVPVLVVGAVADPTSALVAGVAAVVGHCTSPWLRGHGGRGVATAFGAILGAVPWWGLLGLAVFLAVVLATRWVALGSVAAALSVVVVALVAVLSGPDAMQERRLVWAGTLAAIVVFRHRHNLVGRWRQRTGPAA